MLLNAPTHVARTLGSTDLDVGGRLSISALDSPAAAVDYQVWNEANVEGSLERDGAPDGEPAARPR